MTADIISAIMLRNNPISIVVKKVFANSAVVELWVNKPDKVSDPLKTICTEKTPIMKCAGIRIELMMYPIINDLKRIELFLID